jgi:hypothetical protein
MQNLLKGLNFLLFSFTTAYILMPACMQTDSYCIDPSDFARKHDIYSLDLLLIVNFLRECLLTKLLLHKQNPEQT